MPSTTRKPAAAVPTTSSWGRPAAACATARTPRAAAIPIPRSGSRPPTTPAPPRIVAAATRGAATRLVTGPANGTSPTAPSRMGVTANWAATVTPSAAPTQRGRRTGEHPGPDEDPDSCRHRQLKPEVGATDRVRREAHRTPPGPVLSTRSRRDPAALPTSITAAIPAARITEGSQRVTVTKSANPTTPAATLVPTPSERGATTTHHTARNRATLLPETATKCDSPARRSASTSESAIRLVSPIRNPASSAAAGSSMVAEPARHPVSNRVSGAQQRVVGRGRVSPTRCSSDPGGIWAATSGPRVAYHHAAHQRGLAHRRSLVAPRHRQAGVAPTTSPSGPEPSGAPAPPASNRRGARSPGR